MRIPSTTLNWNMPTSRPRFDAGASSPMYIGAVTEEQPTPSPPRNRNTRKVNQLVASADPTAEIRNRNAIQHNVFFRPSRSVGIPPSMAPTTVPISAIETVRPCSKAVRFQICWIFCSAPEITAVSRPNKNPPKAMMTDQEVTLPRIIKNSFDGRYTSWPGIPQRFLSRASIFFKGQSRRVVSHFRHKNN